MTLRISRTLPLAFCLLAAPAAYAADQAPIVVGALGDSISAGFDAQRLGDNRELSWSTGSSPAVNSHARRIATASGRPVTTFNEAVAGSIVTDLDRQVDRMIPHQPDYVTVTIGANDVCTWGDSYAEDLTAYEAELKTQVQRMVDAKPQVQVELSPIPDLNNLWELGSQHGCQARWDLLHICRPLLASGLSSADRDAFVVRWAATNAAIARVAEAFPDNVLYMPDLAHTRFAWEDVSSLDCFHPSVKGQKLFSERTWDLSQHWP